MIVDSHQHLIYPTAEQLQLMDQAGIDKTILFSATPHPERAHNLEEFEQEINLLYSILSGSLSKIERCRSIAGATLELCAVLQNHSDRFYGFGMVPLALSSDETCQWIEKYIVANELKGVGEFSPATGQMQLLEVVFQALSDYENLPLWIHTFSPITMNDILELADLCHKYPSIPVIFGHMGGTNWLDVIKLAKKQPNIYLDLSAAFTTIAPALALRELPDRTLFSSDAPYGTPELSRKMVELISPDDTTTAQVLGGNIMKLLNI